MKLKCELREDGICNCPKGTCKEYDRINKPNHFLGKERPYKKLYR